LVKLVRAQLLGSEFPEPLVVLVNSSQFPDNRSEFVIRSADGPWHTDHEYGLPNDCA